MTCDGTSPGEHDVEAALEFIDRLLLREEEHLGTVAVPERCSTVAAMLVGLRSLVESLARDLADEMGLPGQGRVVIEEYVGSLSVTATLGMATQRVDATSDPPTVVRDPGDSQPSS